MPGFVTHLLFPLLPLLAFTRFPRRLVFALLPLTALPDADYFLGVHRATLTNVWIVVVPLGLWWASRAGTRLARYRDHFAVATVYLGTHLVMDAFVGGVVPFWPISNATWVVDLTIDVDTSANRPLAYFDWGTRPGPPAVSRVYAFLTRTDTAVLAGLAAFAAGLLGYRAARARGRARRAGNVHESGVPQETPEQERGP